MKATENATELRYNLNCRRLSCDCRKCYGLNRDGSVDRTISMAPTCYASPCRIPSVVDVRHVWNDISGRSIYRTNNGILLCDIGMENGKMNLCTMTEDGEPCLPLNVDVNIVK